VSGPRGVSSGANILRVSIKEVNPFSQCAEASCAVVSRVCRQVPISRRQKVGRIAVTRRTRISARSKGYQYGQGLNHQDPTDFCLARKWAPLPKPTASLHGIRQLHSPAIDLTAARSLSSANLVGDPPKTIRRRKAGDRPLLGGSQGNLQGALIRHTRTCRFPPPRPPLTTHTLVWPAPPPIVPPLAAPYVEPRPSPPSLHYNLQRRLAVTTVVGLH